MKYSKIILAASLFLGAASLVNAQTTIRFTGSTAYRGQTHTAILNAMNLSGTAASYGYVGTSFSGASQAIFVGSLTTTAGTSAVTIETSWSGSEAGLQAVAQDSTGQAVNFLSDSTSGLTTGGLSGLTAGTNSQIPDVAMSDTAQATSQFNSTASLNTTDGTSHTYGALVGASTSAGNGIVGVVGFKWVASNLGTYSTQSAPITNMTSQLARALYSVSKIGSGKGLPVSTFTGSTLDSSLYAYPVGRDPDSGTRLTAFAETGLGALKIVTQYQPQNSAAAVITAVGTVAQIALVPVSTVNRIAVIKANGGYSSGGQLAGALGSITSSMTTPQGTGGILIGYLSSGDAATSIAANGKELTYNGATYSTTAIQQGAYTFWAYERMYSRSANAFADAIAAQLYTTDAAILYPSMQVSRGSDGGTVNHL
jgi:hypothetical protein